jgi:UDP-N-acetylglucosamine 2-epimerase (non-hydrolysing)
VQEETTFFKTPCLTLRPNTERPVTLISGTNRLVKIRHIVTAARSLLKSTLPGAGYKIPYLWDGHTAERIVKIIKEQS